MYKKEFEIVKKIIKEVGFFLKEQEIKKVKSLKNKDIKLLLDEEAELKILDQLLSKFKYPILSEELGLTSNIKDNIPYWIVDPIDGTMNYSRGIPTSCISIALYKGDEPILGVIYDFNADELFSALIGEGAWLNDIELVSSSVVTRKSEAILATGFPVYMNLDKKNLVLFISQIQEYKKIRMIGSAALSLAYLSVGRFDAYIEKSIKFWDVAAGIAILKALNIKTKWVMLKDYSIDIEAGIY